MDAKPLKVLILGAGPSGLSIAHTLIDRGMKRDELLVIEKESVAGGLCRSEEVDGAPLDIGGGHFLDVRRKEVLELLFRFLPEDEWNTHHRVAKILLHGQEIDHPLESNLWQLSKADQVDYLESIAQAGSVRGLPVPDSFIDWVQWKLGTRIANDYMIPYNKKIWSMELSRLGTDWLYKLPDVSFRETLRSCLEGRPFGALPAHGIFLYPKKYGYGEVWRRMGEALGDRLILNCPVTSIDLGVRVVNRQWRPETIVNTIPWPLWTSISQVPDNIAAAISGLVHTSVDIDYQPESLTTKAHWIYQPREDVTHHRTLVRHNFVPNSRGVWTETNSKRSQSPIHFRHHNPYAYPVNTRGKSEAVSEIVTWAKSQGVVSAGRWGTWEHMNSDVAVSDGIKLATSLMTNERKAS